jgi:3-isopropylmalate/(R)-2-methylmalate dehydratase small subunit
MEPFLTLQGPAAPLMRDNVDTDVIIRIERLNSVAPEGLGDHALEALRLLPDGSEDPSCVLNRAPFRRAPILLAGRNFGCGSSREGAVWALRARGVRCVIAESFGDIFQNNCFQNGVLPVVLPRAALEQLAAQAVTGLPFVVDLEAMRITLPDGSHQAFEVDAMRRQGLLTGLDEVTRTLRSKAAIDDWQMRDRRAHPWLWEPLSATTTRSTNT